MGEVVTLGVDPDTKTTGWAVATANRVLAVGTIPTSGLRDLSRIAFTVFGALDGISRICIEGQQFHYGGKAPPKDILWLAQHAGALVAAAVLAHPDATVVVPPPSDWKGQTPKNIHQARTFQAYGILYEQRADYCFPTGCQTAARIDGYHRLKNADWKHVADAVGLARWASSL